MGALFADVVIRGGGGGVGSWGLGQVLIAVVVVAAIIGVTIVALRVMEVAIPDWAWKIFWIVVVAVIAIFAIKFLLTL